MNNKVLLTVCLVIVTAAGLYKFTHQPCASCPAQETSVNTEVDFAANEAPAQEPVEAQAVAEHVEQQNA